MIDDVTVSFTPSDGGADRFVIDGVGREVGIVDTKKNEFAKFLGKDPVELRRRLERAVSRLNSGEDTPTGYVWEKVA